jgi:hypothetical protein
MMPVFLLIFAIADDLIFKTEQDIDFELILKDLESLRNRPLDLNSARVEDLVHIPYLTLNNCIKIVEHRARYGPYDTIEDLLQIADFDRALVEAISPFVTVGIKLVPVKKITARARAQTELPRKEQSLEYYTKTGILVDQYGLHAVTEKDAYEEYFFDHYALGLFVDEGKRKFALGKYNLDLGAGVVLSSVGSFFRGIDFRIMMAERGLIPYTSTVENGGFFGAAIRDSFFLNYTLFYSNQKLDGRIDSLGYAHSFDQSGEHIDSLSLSHKDQINEEMFGYDLRYQATDFLIANRTYYCNYSPAFVTEDSIAKFYGKDFYITGLEFRYSGESFVLFSELARSWKNHVGGLFGFSAVFPYIDVNLAGKYFPAAFVSPKGVEVTANSAQGTIDIKHHSRLVDVGVNLTLDNRLDEDTTRYDLRLSLGRRIGILDGRVNLRSRYRGENRDLSGTEVLLRINTARFLFLDLRFEEKSVYENGWKRGIFGAFEIGFDLEDFDLRVRYGMFDSDSYTARIYAYEIDLPGIVNNRMLYDKGNYGFIYLAFRPIQRIRLSAKYSKVKRDTFTAQHMGGQIDFSF